jgi:chromosome segregation ATPase
VPKNVTISFLIPLQYILYTRGCYLDQMATLCDNKDLFQLRWASWQLEIIRFNQKLSEANKIEEFEDNHYVNFEEAAVMTMSEADIEKLKQNLQELNTRLRESVSQRAILESIISERLESERAATTTAKELKSALLRISAKCTELTKEKENQEKEVKREREVASRREARLRFLEEKLLEVETFLLSDQGKHVIQLEAELAEAKLAVAELESEKDELEQQISYYMDMNGEEENDSIRNCEDDEEEVEEAYAIENRSSNSETKLTMMSSNTNSTIVQRKPLAQWNGQNQSITNTSTKQVSSLTLVVKETK